MTEIWWASDWRCFECGHSVPIEPAQDTRPIREAHTCDPIDRDWADLNGAEFGIDLADGGDS